MYVVDNATKFRPGLEQIENGEMVCQHMAREGEINQHEKKSIRSYIK